MPRQVCSRMSEHPPPSPKVIVTYSDNFWQQRSNFLGSVNSTNKNVQDSWYKNGPQTAQYANVIQLNTHDQHQ